MDDGGVDAASDRPTSMQILELLPHRYPFLLVDRIVDIDGDESCVGIKNVTMNEPQFTGHFPGPAGLSGRAPDRGHGADGGGDLRRRPARPGERTKDVFFLTIDKAKFRQPVVPGDTVEYHMRKISAAQEHVVVPRRGEGRRRAGLRGRGRRHADRRMSEAVAYPVREAASATSSTRRRSSSRARGSATACGSGRSAMSARNVEIGDGCDLISHVVVAGHTTIGPRATIYPFASIGHPPQHLQLPGRADHALASAPIA